MRVTNPHHCEKYPLHSAWILLRSVAKRRLLVMGLKDFYFFVGFGEGFVVWLLLQTQLLHTLSFPSPSLVLPVGWTGFILFRCVAVECNSSTVLAQLSVFPVKATTFPRDYKTTASSENIQISALCFLTLHLLNKDTKSIHEHIVCLNIFVIIKYIKKCLKHAIIPYNALWPYYFVKPSTLSQVVVALNIYFLNNTILESSICQQILTYSSPVEITFYHHLVVYKFSCHSPLQIISCTCG